MARSAMDWRFQPWRETEAGSDVGVEVPWGPEMTGNPDRNGKGFHREVKSEGSRMGSSGPRNTNCIRGTRPGKRRGGRIRANRKGHPELGRV